MLVKIYELVPNKQINETSLQFLDLYGRVLDVQGWRDKFLTLTKNEDIISDLHSKKTWEIIPYIEQVWKVKFSIMHVSTLY